MRQQFIADLRRRFKALERELHHLIVVEDAFGLRETSSPTIRRLGTTINQRWKFQSNQQQTAGFLQWVKSQTDQKLKDQYKGDNDKYWNKYIQEGYRKGAGRAFDDTRKKGLVGSRAQLDFYNGTKQEFMRSAFGQPETIEKLNLLTSRTFTELENVTSSMAATMSRDLADGLVRGENPLTIARTLRKDLSLSAKRAETIARTEIIRAHSEGQLDALDKLGVQQVGVQVEWSTAGDDRVCPRCQPLEGAVFTIKEAHGLIPRHPNCRCAFLPANVGESTTGQHKTQKAVQKTIDKSIAAELPKKGKRTLAQQKKLTSWTGADKKIVKARPKRVINPGPSDTQLPISEFKDTSSPINEIFSPEEPRFNSTSEWKKSLTAPEKEAIKSWQGLDYSKMRRLDKGESVNDILTDDSMKLYGKERVEKSREKLERDYANFQKALSRAPLEEGTFYRGIDLKESDFLKEFVPGNTVELKGISSFSRDKIVADDFAAGGHLTKDINQSRGGYLAANDRVAVTITSKTEGIDISSATKLKVSKRETEVLVKSGKYQVKSVTKGTTLDGKAAHYTVEIEPIKTLDTGSLPPDITRVGTKEELKRINEIAKRRSAINKKIKAGAATPEEVEEVARLKSEFSSITAELRQRARGGGIIQPPPLPPPVKPTIKPPTPVLKKVEVKPVVPPPPPPAPTVRPLDTPPTDFHLPLDKRIANNVELDELQKKLASAYEAKQEVTELKSRITQFENYIETRLSSLRTAERRFQQGTVSEEALKEIREDIEGAIAESKERIAGFRAELEQKPNLEDVTKLVEVPREDRLKFKASVESDAAKTTKTKADKAAEFLEAVTKKRSSMHVTHAGVREYHRGHRAFYRQSEDAAHMALDNPVKTFVHEFGHHLEYNLPNAQRLANEFRNMRVARSGKKDVSMNKVIKTSAYGPEEIGNDDNFRELFAEKHRAYYVGKTYAHGATEIMSMGLEELYKDPLRMAAKDPEYFKFIVGVVRGLL